MRKSILSASIAAMIGGLTLAGAANAAVFSGGADATGLSLDNTGVGHILVVPYFTTQNGFTSLLNIVNTDTTNGKALKVRFRGASNSDDILDFQVFLSPGDAWAANISQDPTTGYSKLTTPDTSCTVPASITTSGSLFGNSRLNQSLTAAQQANETREGYIEILTMADIPKAATADQATATPANPPTVNPLYTAVAHTAATTAAACTGVSSLKDPTYYTDTSSAANAAKTAQGQGLAYPTGGIFANFTLINVASTATFSGQATAVRATKVAAGKTVNAAGNLVFFPQNYTVGTGNFVSTPVGTGLTTGNATTPGTLAVGINAVTADPLLRTYNIAQFSKASGNIGLATVAAPAAKPVISANNVDLPDLSTAYTGVTYAAYAGATPVAADTAAYEAAAEAATRGQAAALTASLAATSVVNEYLTSTSISAKNDWVFSMPTRRYNVAYNYGYKSVLNIGDDGRVFTDYNTATINAAYATANYSGQAVTTAVDTANYFTLTNTSVVNSSISGVPQICVASNASGFTSYDREETTAGALVGVSPAPLGQAIAFCGETSILAINNGTSATSSGVFGASVAFQNVNVPATEGWMTVGTTGLTSKGLPVVGASFAKSTAFGTSWGHRYVRP